MKVLFILVHEDCVPATSPQAKEINRIKREEIWAHARDDLEPETEEFYGKDVIAVCGAYTEYCVRVHTERIQEIRDARTLTFIHHPASFSIRYFNLPC